MLMNVAIGMLMMLLTTSIHAVSMVGILKLLVYHARRLGLSSELSRLRVVSFAAVLLFAAALVEIGLWAAVFLLTDAIDGVEHAVYFSTVSFTTLGYGDVVLDENWRLLGSFEAANGIILFGWTTALLIAVVQRVYAPILNRSHADDGGNGRATQEVTR